MQDKTLIAVAQRAKARFFLHAPGQGFDEITDLVHPESRAHGIELASDRPGRVHESHGPGRSAMAKEETPKEREASNFAREVAEAIRDRRTANAFDGFVLVAEPGFLGLLREALDDATSKTLHGEVRKDIVERPLDEIKEHLADLLLMR